MSCDEAQRDWQGMTLKELRNELRYWQSQARIDARTLRADRGLIKEIGAELRKRQLIGKVTRGKRQA